jgi:hypothetical protein
VKGRKAVGTEIWEIGVHLCGAAGVDAHFPLYTPMPSRALVG